MISETRRNNSSNFAMSVGGRRACQQVRRGLHSKEKAEWVEMLTGVLKKHIVENKTARI
jgi:hypothetical protein